MELKQLINLITKNKLPILLSGLVAAVVGIFVFLLVPARYIATGSLFISRQIESNSDKYYSYDGYYGQQTAQTYTNTIQGLVDSSDAKSLALEKQGKQVDTETLRKLNKSLVIKKTNSQIITLTVTNFSKDTAVSTWNSLTDATLELSTKLNATGDPLLHVAKVTENPIFSTEYKNVFVNMVLGYGLGSLLATLIIALKEYLK